MTTYLKRATLEVDEILADLGLVVAIRQQIVACDPQFRANLLDRQLVGFARDLDVSFVTHGNPLTWWCRQ